jgi:flagella synthesis protein FlgN
MSPHHIRNILLQEHDTARKLLEILTQEHTALIGNDLQGLETILAAKQQCMTRLEKISRDFLAFMHEDTTVARAGITAFLRQRDPQGTLKLVSLWQQVEKLLSHCRQKNSVNGKIISLNHRHIQGALSILRHGGQGLEPCYSPTGASQATVSSRILGKV